MICIVYIICSVFYEFNSIVYQYEIHACYGPVVCVGGDLLAFSRPLQKSPPAESCSQASEWNLQLHNYLTLFLLSPTQLNIFHNTLRNIKKKDLKKISTSFVITVTEVHKCYLRPDFCFFGIWTIEKGPMIMRHILTKVICWNQDFVQKQFRILWSLLPEYMIKGRKLLSLWNL